MRCLALLVAIVAAFVMVLAINMIHVLSCLAGTGIDIAPLVHGDLRLLLGFSPVWSWPSCPHPSNLLRFGPAAMMLTVGAFLLAAARRWTDLPGAAFALLALASGVLPYAVGAIALRDNTVEELTGPWLIWMLIGPLYAALLAFAFLLRDPFLRWQRRRTAAMPAAAPAVAR